MSGTTADPFFWNDWQSDISLRTCSLAAQGFWMQLLCIAAQSTQKGVVLVNGKRPTTEVLSQVTGATLDEVKALSKELLEKGVASLSSGRALYCRRMVRAAAKRRACAEGGAKGGRVTLEKQIGIHASRGNGKRGISESTRARPFPSPSPFSYSSSSESSSEESVGADPSTRAAAPAVTPAEELIEIPTNKTGEVFTVLPSLIAEYERDYPNVDIEQQLRAMRAWSISNEARRKTKGGMKTFINKWLAKEQNRGGNNGRGAQKAELAAKAKQERLSWLKEYAFDGRWIRNSSGNGVWRDTHGVGPPPHDERTLVTEEDYAQYPKAKLMREKLRKGFDSPEPPLF